MNIKKAVKVLIKELKKDDEYYYSWQANIAMNMYDRMCLQKKGYISKKVMHSACNLGAKDFLNALTNSIKLKGLKIKY